MNGTVVNQEMAVAVQEEGRRESLAWALHLRVAESEPDFLYLVFAEETVDDFDVSAQESHVGQFFFQSLCGSGPHAGTLDVNTDEVHVGIELGQLYGVFAFAASEFKHDGVVVLEVLLMPVAFHVKGNVFHYRIRVLEHVAIGGQVGEFL